MAAFAELFQGVRNVWANMRVESLSVDGDIESQGDFIINDIVADNMTLTGDIEADGADFNSLVVGGETLTPETFLTDYEPDDATRFSAIFEEAFATFFRIGKLVYVRYAFVNPNNAATQNGTAAIKLNPAVPLPAEFQPTDDIIYPVMFQDGATSELGHVAINETDGSILLTLGRVDAATIKYDQMRDGVVLRILEGAYVYKVA